MYRDVGCGMLQEKSLEPCLHEPAFKIFIYTLSEKIGRTFAKLLMVVIWVMGLYTFFPSFLRVLQISCIAHTFSVLLLESGKEQ